MSEGSPNFRHAHPELYWPDDLPRLREMAQPYKMQEIASARNYIIAALATHGIEYRFEVNDKWSKAVWLWMDCSRSELLAAVSALPSVIRPGTSDQNDPNPFRPDLFVVISEDQRLIEVHCHCEGMSWFDQLSLFQRELWLDVKKFGDESVEWDRQGPLPPSFLERYLRLIQYAGTRPSEVHALQYQWRNTWSAQLSLFKARPAQDSFLRADMTTSDARAFDSWLDHYHEENWEPLVAVVARLQHLHEFQFFARDSFPPFLAPTLRRFHPATRNYHRPLAQIEQEWQALLATSDIKPSPAAAASLESLTFDDRRAETATEHMLLSLTTMVDLSQLRSLEIGVNAEPDLLARVAPRLTGLTRLYVNMVPGTTYERIDMDMDSTRADDGLSNVGDVEGMILAVQAFRPLQYLCLRGLRSFASLARIIAHHGPTLKGLGVEAGETQHEYPDNADGKYPVTLSRSLIVSRSYLYPHSDSEVRIQEIGRAAWQLWREMEQEVDPSSTHMPKQLHLILKELWPLDSDRNRSKRWDEMPLLVQSFPLEVGGA
ncbi:hypothetical protein BO99DRAFT_436698 [Aspergillus violaceofuscus CBS 115571]|uniref:Uncharacterized protein n=1 Tax=Aspergillus violaceofuscus (strain CBS 115571) TaxID=1450538 RepID=A0A2V5GV87_ASPV1|nr:hypothetical protein BO99DRAFT_436698 [Aspergillus violaceofuscus CBS 115571]